MVPTSPDNRFNRSYTNDNEDDRTNQNTTPSWRGKLQDSRLVTKEPRPDPPPPPQNESQEDR